MSRFARQVVVRRDRLCVTVKAGRQGELPKGSVTLAMSSTKVRRLMHGVALKPCTIKPVTAVALGNIGTGLGDQG